jgi:hypothetical protein
MPGDAPKLAPARLVTHEPRTDGSWRAGLVGGEYRDPTAADVIAHVNAMPAEEAWPLLVAMVKARDAGPRPWRDGDPRCHCTHCDSCWRLYRTEDINAHRNVCPMRLLQVRGVLHG